jgi:hypothetical protein
MNLGGGGGGGCRGTTGTQGASGGSGVVILAYPVDFKDPNIGNGLTYTRNVTSRAGYKVFTFTGGTDTVSW